ncbi:hypothetical protein C8N24_4773 [Solirubrobacter pauli]|uniref:Collagen triple helix repeat protein n=1 Tax=Solirubrobacter pauli TaxID=166793 RepID=A0A660L004_9ACTN|nr:hypothetical protein [Solirubrobacter pauli]RKQ86758.1 hypothetical protein C8N24_4773 [Solirubrobacter pauli]
MQALKRPGVWLGTIAVVLGMGGSAIAASQITSAQIKDGTIQAKDIKRGAIGTAQLSSAVKDNLTGGDGFTGATGPAGPAGPAGPPGAPGLAGVERVESIHFSLAPGQFSPNVTANCSPGKVVVGTGYYGSVAETNFVKAYTTFVGGFMVNDTNITVSDLHFQAICASAGGAVAASAARSATSAAYAADRKQILTARSR